MPTSRKLKPLAVGSCISDLTKHAGNVKISISSDLQCRQYCTSFNGVFKKAEAKYEDGDEESAYILFMRLLYIFEGIKKSYEYQRQKKVYNDLINVNNVKKAMERAESLSKSLEARYEQLELDRKSLQSARAKLNSSQDSGSESNKGLSKRPPPLNDILAPKDKKTGSERNGNVVKLLPDVPPLDDQMDVGSSAKTEPDIDPWLDPDEFYNLLKSGNTESILVIDTRPPGEFNASSIKNNSISMINVQDELLKPGANVNSIERRLSNDVWNHWKARTSKDHIVILDHNGTRESTTKDSPIQILKDAIYNSSIKTKSEPRFLSSGFSGWQTYYPSLCTNRFYEKKKPAPTVTIPDATKLLSNLSYPSLNGLKTNIDRPPSTARSVNPPGSDEKSEAPKSKQDGSGNEGDDTFAKLRRPLDGVPESKFSPKPPDNQPHDYGRYPAHEIITEPHGSDTRPKTGLSSTTFKRDETNGGVPNVNTDSGNRLDSLKANQADLKGIPFNSINNSVNSKAQTAPEMARLPSRPGEDNVNFVNSNNNRRPDPTDVRERNIDNIEILTAKYTRGVSDYGLAPNNFSVRPHGNDHGHGSKFRAISDKGDGCDPVERDGKHKVGSNFSKPITGGMFRGDSLDSAQRRKEGQSPIKGIPDAGKTPNPVGSHPGPTEPGSGKYATMPRIQGQVQPPASGRDSRTSTNQSTNVGPSVPQNGRNSGTGTDGGFSSNTFPRATVRPSSGNISSTEHLRPSSGVQNIPTPGMSGPMSGGNAANTVPSSSQARPMAGSNIPPASPQPQKWNQYPATQYQPGVTGHQGSPRLVHMAQQPHSLPLERDRPETAKSATKEQRTDLKSNPSEFITSPGLPYGWEKSIDPKTGRVYYMDHTTKSTHWELPPDFYANRERDATIKQKRQAPEPPVMKDTGETTSGLKRSLSTPNLADLDADKENSKPVTPIVDRSSKPLQPKAQLVDRSTKPLSKSRLENLSPVYGTKGRNLTGLKNLGNTCYMNSVVQCLSSTAPLAYYFNSGAHLKHLNSRSMNRRPEEIAKELAFLVKVLWSGQYRSVSPIDFKAAIGRFASQFAGYKQQDAHEFLMFFMDGIHEDTNKIKRRTPMIEQNNDNIPDAISSVKAWRDYAKNNDSIIVDLFQGQFRSTVCCKACGRKSVTFDVFSCLPLELTSRRACTLDDCIRAFTKPERIGGNDSWKCSECKVYREATKTIELWKLPPVIIFQLKRFSSDGRWHNKLQTKVDFPISELDTSRYLVGPGSELSRYNLYSVVNHYGSFESGHYTAYCLNQQSWYCYNDNTVSSIDRQELKSPAAYLLFYTAVDFKAYLK